jgi:3-oxoacyl-[acyl-carrier-protein] synthase II
MAEGGGALVLESLAIARARNADILAVVAGCGERADFYHRTRSHPDGSAVIGAIRNALADADLAPDQIDYINAHGTSTPENDKMEALACGAVFGERAASVPISSNKSMIGHTLTAAGAVEAVFTAMTIMTGVIPPTINYREPDPAIRLDVVPNEAREARVRTAMSNSFGFGGQNVCLVLSDKP